jgi:hypothetical protein
VRSGTIAQPQYEERDMAQESLLQMLEELANKVRSLEREKRQADITIQGLEREVGELASLITLAGEKVDEILKVGATDDIPRPPVINAPTTSTSPGRFGEFSADPQRH